MITRAQQQVKEEDRSKISEKSKRNDSPKEARILENIKKWFPKLQILTPS